MSVIAVLAVFIIMIVLVPFAFEQRNGFRGRSELADLWRVISYPFNTWLVALCSIRRFEIDGPRAGPIRRAVRGSVLRRALAL